MEATATKTATTKTTCPYCGVGCGIITSVAADGSVAIRGDTEHPANFGRLCSKGSALAKRSISTTACCIPRSTAVAQAGTTRSISSPGTFSRTIAEHGPDSVALYVSGQLLTEDYYVANKLMKGFIGAANIDTNSRLCMASSVAGHRRAFGADTVPGTTRISNLRIWLCSSAPISPGATPCSISALRRRSRRARR